MPAPRTLRISPANIIRHSCQWLETKRKRKLEAHEVFSEDPALYRWQCWASTQPDPNSKDPTFVEDLRFRSADAKVGFGVRKNTGDSNAAPLLRVQINGAEVIASRNADKIEIWVNG